MRKYVLVLLLFPSLCFAETSLWQISKNGNHLYLGGTIHVLKKTDYPLPAEFTRAFEKSDKLMFETDIEKAKSPEFGKKMAQMMMLPAGKSLKGVLNKKTFDRLKQYLAAKNIPIDNFLSFKPSMVVLILTVIELKAMGMMESGVDEYFHKKSKQAEKSIGYFETVDEQLAFLQTMGQGNEDAMVMSSINDMSKMSSTMDLIKVAWLNGDEKKLVKVALADMIRDYPGIYQTLLVKRNNNWMPHIERMMQDKPVEMILVGALHLVGEVGLLQQLRNKGYQVTKFK
jgi:hypothetical protein